MKTAVSIPDDIFEEAERLAERTQRSRSEVYARALAEYVARHAPDRVTEAMDQALSALNGDEDAFASTVGRRTLKRTEW
jgi:predicted transcriptional regulator